jgi:DNA-binding transcriptional LysR family regulator
MNLKILYRMSVFYKVAAAGSFTQAADELHLSKSVVSEHVRELEQDLGTRLLNRSTRSISLTQEGFRLADATAKMLRLVEATLRELEQGQTRPSGLIRVTASHNFVSVYLAAAMLRFRELHPNVEVEIDAADSITNIVETGHDVAFRIGWLKSSDLQAMKICDFAMIPCATPRHFERFGPVESPLDMAIRPWVAITIMSDFDRIVLSARNGDDVTIPISPAIRTNSGLTARQMVLGGDCIGLLPDYAVRDDIAAGRLVRLLPDWSHRPGEIAAIYAHKQSMSPRLRAFLDFLRVDARTHFGG